ncbi:hypothetical protein N665_0126s0036 [Sinapis alba]|nr:hypothetical protein N665_0126s0036 [Sinapis alba]
MENKLKKISSAVVPKESDFMDVIITLKKQTTTWTYDDNDSFAMHSCSDNVYDEFPSVSRIGPFYRGILHQRFDYTHYADAREEVSFASLMMINISQKYLSLFSAADCDSLDKCKSLQRHAFACMLAVVRRCVPCLAFLDKVRDYMAYLDDDGVGGGEHPMSTDFPVPQLTQCEFDENIAHLVHPQTLAWLEELDRVPSRKDADQSLGLHSHE